MEVSDVIKDLGNLLNLKVSVPVQRLLRVIVRSPLYVVQSFRKKYLESVKEMTAIDLLPDAKEKDINFLVETRKKWLQNLDMSKADIDLIKSDLMNFSIYRDVLEDLQNDVDESENEDSEINEHWFDLLHSFYKMRNEPWRKNLILNALKNEAINPGQTSNKTIWNIALMEKQDFHDLYDFMTSSVRFYGYAVVGYYGEILTKEYSKLSGGIGSYRDLFDRLEAEGNLTLGNGCLTIGENSIVKIISKTKSFIITGNGLTDENPDIKFLSERGVDVSDEKKNSQIYAITLNKRGHQITTYFDWNMSEEAEHQFLSSLEQQKHDNNLSVVVDNA